MGDSTTDDEDREDRRGKFCLPGRDRLCHGSFRIVTP